MDLERGRLLAVVAPFRSIQVGLIQSQTDNIFVCLKEKEQREIEIQKMTDGDKHILKSLSIARNDLSTPIYIMVKYG